MPDCHTKYTGESSPNCWGHLQGMDITAFPAASVFPHKSCSFLSTLMSDDKTYPFHSGLFLWHILSNIQSHLSRQYNCWLLRCSWSIACWRWANYIFIHDLKPRFNGLGKDDCKTRWETSKLWDLACFLLEVWHYIHHQASVHWEDVCHFLPDNPQQSQLISQTMAYYGELFLIMICM